jgi:hypothetical protein
VGSPEGSDSKDGIVTIPTIFLAITGQVWLVFLSNLTIYHLGLPSAAYFYFSP